MYTEVRKRSSKQKEKTIKYREVLVLAFAAQGLFLLEKPVMFFVKCVSVWRRKIQYFSFV